MMVGTIVRFLLGGALLTGSVVSQIPHHKTVIHRTTHRVVHPVKPKPKPHKTVILPRLPTGERYTTFQSSQEQVGGKTYTTHVVDTSGSYYVPSVPRDFPSASKHGVTWPDPTTMHVNMNTSGGFQSWSKQSSGWHK